MTKKNGRIVKALADFYYVYTEGETYQCKAKGIFRKRDHTPLVGDLVTIELTNAQDIEGNIISIENRIAELKRPSVANVDLVLLVFAVKDPEPNFYLMDRFLVIMENLGLDTVIVFNKTDLDEKDRGREYAKAYREIGYKCLLTCTSTGEGLDLLKSAIQGKVTSVAGPSGVGKSSLINALVGRDAMETGSVSTKNRRGKQTTRHTELLPVNRDTFMVDTPGFSSTDVTHIPAEDLSGCFPDFLGHLGSCRFSGCSHISEPDCGVKVALEQGQIQKARYDNYIKMYMEIKDVKRY